MIRHRPRGGGHEDEEHENSERWLLTYADMITLLLALFIVLFSISVVNKSKLEALQKSLGVHPATGVPDYGQPPKTPGVTPVALATPNAGLEALKEQLEKALADAGLAKSATFTVDQFGLSVQLTDGVLFDSAKATLLPGGIQVLAVIGPIIAKKTNAISIQGHTDDKIIATAQYPTNWELSTARATSVLRYLLAADKIAPARLSATGYADTHPLVPNTNDANRARNRRVTVLIAATAPAAATTTPVTSPSPNAKVSTKAKK
jgi:chemotaxis protein MotB